MTSLRSFPTVTPAEFLGACRSLMRAVDRHGDIRSLGWTKVKLVEEGPVLAISKGFESSEAISENPAGQDYNKSWEEVDTELERDDDPEALIRESQLSSKVEVEYSIVLSPTYRVPVLYFSLRKNLPGKLEGVDAVYSYLVPSQYKTQLSNIGIMGGLSIGHHPISDHPAYFVHPCNTAEALRDVAGNKEPAMETYLILWLGLVGNCVSLHIPSELLVHRSNQEMV